MEDTHVNPLYFYDNSPPPFVTIRGEPEGQESRPMSTMGHTDFFKAQEGEDGEEACLITVEEEALLQTLQNKKMRSRASKEPVNPTPTTFQSSSTK